MAKISVNNINKRHQAFKRELRAYHDSINRTNRYNLAKIAGKLNLFEALNSEGDEEETEKKYEIDRKIPNTHLMVLKRDELYAIGDENGDPLTEFKYSFIEGCLGEHDKIIRCITDDGEMEDFSIELQRIVEDAMGGGMGVGTTGTVGMGVGDVSTKCSGGSDCDYHEIDYTDTREQLEIPFLCGARVVDIKNKRKRRKKRRKVKSVSESAIGQGLDFEVHNDYIRLKIDGEPAAVCDFNITTVGGIESEYGETLEDFDYGIFNEFNPMMKVMSIESVYVVPEYRRQGYGKAIVSEAMRLANSEGITQFILRAHPEERLIAIGSLVEMYRSLGFIPRQYLGDDGWIMTKVDAA